MALCLIQTQATRAGIIPCVSDLNASEWDAFVQAHPDAHILQTGAWAELKTKFGWRAARVVARKHGDPTILGGAQVLFRPMPLDIGSVAYVPRGPLTDWNDDDLTAYVIDICHDIAQRDSAWVLKLEPDLPDTPEHAERLRKLGFRPSAHTIQPPRTIVIDLRPDEDTLLANMKQKTRYNIRLAEKKGVTVRQAEPDQIEAELARFNALMQTTGERDAFGVHSADYYAAAYALFSADDQVALFFAEYEGRPLSTVMVFAVAGRAYYLYGASSNEERQRMPSYAVQWAAIRWAKARGCTSYDMYGVPDFDEATLEAEFTERSDGLWPVYRFKRGWGGELVRTVGTWDYVYSRIGYQLYKFATARRG